MADEPEDAPLSIEEDEGGPVKSFLEHLEDLRWTIIRCAVAVLVSMVVCLAAGNKVIAFLKLPLAQASRFGEPSKPTVFVEMAGTTLGRFDFNTNALQNFSLGSNAFARVEVEVVDVGTNRFLGLRLNTNAPPSDLAMVKLSTLGPMGGFMVAFQVAIYAGIGLASPFLLLFLGQFLLPALRQKEKQFIYRSLGVGILLFLAGVAFCYTWVLPATLKASAAFSEWEGFSADQWRAEEYMSFICKFMLAMGVSFELPIVILAMVKIGLLDYPKLARFRAYFVIVNLFLSALLSPGADLFSMMMMALPLQVLYEVSLWIAWFWYRADLKKAAL